MDKIGGLIAASYTPLDENGELKLELLEPYLHYLLANNVKGVFINGSTGDFASLTLEERLQVLDAWCSIKPDNFIFMAHIGTTNFKESRELAAHAASKNIDGIATLAPYYFKPASVEALVELCAELASTAPHIPFYYYHIPALSGANFSMRQFIELASKRIPNFGGIKFTEENLMDFRYCLKYDDGKYNILFGVDEILVSGLAIGAKGAIGSTYNHLAPLYYEIIDCYKNNEMERAQQLQDISIQFVRILVSYGFSAAAKATMKMLGIDLGPSRLPHGNLSEQQMTSMQKEFKAAGIFKILDELKERSSINTTQAN
jgi:N-acetylneuraminate lyase